MLYIFLSNKGRNLRDNFASRVDHNITTPSQSTLTSTMSESFTLLDVISASSIIKVRIIRMYARTSSNIPHTKLPLELVLVDENGTRIEAIVQGNLRWRFAGRLHEFSTVIISNFGLVDHTGSFKLSKHERKIFFRESTIVKACDSLPGSPHGFSFADFSTVLSTTNLDEYLIDIIGELIEFGDVITFSNKEVASNPAAKPTKSRLIVKLEDHTKTVLRCTLWEDYAAEMSKYLSSFQGNRVIFILQFAKITIYRGEVSVSNSLWGSRLLLDQDIPEIVEFKTTCVSDGALVSHPISHIRSCSSSSPTQQFLQSSDMKLLSELDSITEDCVCVVLATIAEFEDKNTWFYSSCLKCKRSVASDGDIFYCLNCDKQIDYPVQRYKLKIKVSDVSGTSSLVMFDEEVQYVVHKSVKSLLEDQSGDYLDSFPEQLNILLNKTFLFRIELKAYFCNRGDKRFTIKKMKADEGLIEQLTSAFPSLQESISETSDSHKLATGGGDPDLSTPHKRLRTSANVGDDTGGCLMSTTKETATVKIEKDAVKVEENAAKIKKNAVKVEDDAVKVEEVTVKVEEVTVKIEYDAVKVEEVAVNIDEDAA